MHKFFGRFVICVSSRICLLTPLVAVIARVDLSAQTSGESRALRAAVAEEQRGVDQGRMLLSKTSAAYKLGIADLIAVNVYQEPDLTVSVKVGDDGTVVLPLLGSVKVGGLSVKEATATLTSLYNKDYLVDPVVTITVVEATKGKITILGAVGRPGIVEIPAEGTVPIIEAIAMAGGFSRIANESKITVKRVIAGKEQVFKINGKEQASSQESKVFTVRSGDVITIAESLF